MEHWQQYESYNTVADAQGLLDVAQDLKELSARLEANNVCDEDDPEGIYWMAEALVGIGQRLSRLDTRYPYPDPIPEHWGPKP